MFSYCPVFTYLASLLFHEKRLNCTVPGATAASSASTHGRFNLLLSHSPSHVFLCLKLGYLAFPYNQRTDSSSSAVHSQSPGFSEPRLLRPKQKKEYQPPASMRESKHEWEHLPFLPSDPTIVMDLRLTCTTVSLQSSSDLSGTT